MIGQVIQLRDGFGFISCKDNDNMDDNNNNKNSNDNVYFRRNDIPIARIGDTVLFDVNYGDRGPVASNIKMYEKKTDRIAKNLLELGAKKEIGIIESLIKDFGFISTNSNTGGTGEVENEKIYFRIEDVLNTNEYLHGVRKGAYVEYLIIEEKSKGSKHDFTITIFMRK